MCIGCGGGAIPMEDIENGLKELRGQGAFLAHG